MRKKLSANRLARCGVLTAAALVLSLVERLLPSLPVPGVKLGLSNLAAMAALCLFGAGDAWFVLLAKCILGAVFAGNVSGLMFSLTGGMMALLLMTALLRTGKFSVYGLSMAGAAAHNMGQVLVASILLRTTAPVLFLPILLTAALLAGALNGFLLDNVLARLRI